MVSIFFAVQFPLAEPEAKEVMDAYCTISDGRFVSESLFMNLITICISAAGMYFCSMVIVT